MDTPLGTNQALTHIVRGVRIAQATKGTRSFPRLQVNLIPLKTLFACHVSKPLTCWLPISDGGIKVSGYVLGVPSPEKPPFCEACVEAKALGTLEGHVA